MERRFGWWLVGATAFIASSAWAEEGPTGFDRALVAARSAHKPLVINFGSVGCAPCKRLNVALKAQERRAELADVHFVELRLDTEAGRKLGERFGVRGTPTLLAVGPDAREVARWIDFDGDIEAVLDWLREVPHRLLPLDETIARADRDPANLELQLIAGKRLSAVGRRGDAHRYLTRAIASPRPDIAAAASWANQAGGDAAERRRTAEEILTRYPRSRPTLAVLDDASVGEAVSPAVLETALRAQSEVRRGQWRVLDRLVWLALRAGLADVAEDIVKTLAPVVPPDTALIYAIEIQNSRGQEREARESLIALKARSARTSRLYPIVLSELEARIARSRREPPSKPLLVRLEEASGVLRASVTEPTH
jgi:thiol-disulfide isomerase/thioredoxin